jgi:class 3 adenylate cyclase
MLVQFPTDQRQLDTIQAVRAGLRMQRAMAHFAKIETAQETFSLRMRIGIHTGRFFTADIGTPRRRDHVLLGSSVQHTKRAEGAGQIGRVCLTDTALARVQESFRYEPGRPGYGLVVDDLSDEQLGEYEIAPPSRRTAGALLIDRSIEGLLKAIEDAVSQVEPLASYIPTPVLNLVVENAARRKIPPDFPRPTIIFVNLVGLPESFDRAQPEEEGRIAHSFSRVFALINAAVEARGGVLKKVTYHLTGSDMMILFGVPNAHTNDPVRAAQTALAIREIVNRLETPHIGGQPVSVHCQIGIARGPVFAAEIGEPRGRREFNVLGDTVNTAARLMSRATAGQILVTEAVYTEVAQSFDCDSLGPVSLKGKSVPVPIYALLGQRD